MSTAEDLVQSDQCSLQCTSWQRGNDMLHRQTVPGLQLVAASCYRWLCALMRACELLSAGLLRTGADKVLVFGGMAQEDMFLLPDMFELSISQRWWRQARPRAQC